MSMQVSVEMAKAMLMDDVVVDADADADADATILNVLQKGRRKSKDVPRGLKKRCLCDSLGVCGASGEAFGCSPTSSQVFNSADLQFVNSATLDQTAAVLIHPPLHFPAFPVSRMLQCRCPRRRTEYPSTDPRRDAMNAVMLG
jgi:hypothetical protein